MDFQSFFFAKTGKYGYQSIKIFIMVDRSNSTGEIMKKIILGLTLSLLSTLSLANNTTTALDSHWICTTNASNSDNVKEQTADSNMEKTQKSATEAFAYATEHCRDCTKVTCEFQD